MRIALNIRNLPHYRRGVFEQGVVAAGHTIADSTTGGSDALVIWNRYGGGHQQAKVFDTLQRPVIVAENAYTRRDHYALALGYHNTALCVPHPVGQSRTEPDMVSLPSHDPDGHILVLPQRGIGPPGRAMPQGWAQNVAWRLGRVTRRHVTIRQHPGTRTDAEPLSEALRGVYAVVTWGSSAAIKAAFAGIPVFYEYPHWIAADIGQFGIRNIERATIDADACARFASYLTWCQWSADEIASGEPFERLLNNAYICNGHKRQQKDIANVW